MPCSLDNIWSAFYDCTHKVSEANSAVSIDLARMKLLGQSAFVVVEAFRPTSYRYCSCQLREICLQVWCTPSGTNHVKAANFVVQVKEARQLYNESARKRKKRQSGHTGAWILDRSVIRTVLYRLSYTTGKWSMHPLTLYQNQSFSSQKAKK